MLKSLSRYKDMTEYITKINQLDQELDNEIVHRQVNEIRQIDNYVKKQALASSTKYAGVIARSI